MTLLLPNVKQQLCTLGRNPRGRRGKGPRALRELGRNTDMPRGIQGRPRVQPQDRLQEHPKLLGQWRESHETKGRTWGSLRNGDPPAGRKVTGGGGRCCQPEPSVCSGGDSGGGVCAGKPLWVGRMAAFLEQRATVSLCPRWRKSSLVFKVLGSPASRNQGLAVFALLPGQAGHGFPTPALEYQGQNLLITSHHGLVALK